MDQKSLERRLAGLGIDRIAYFDQVGSSNDVVADWTREGFEGLGVAVADEQTKGRGRSGRKWFTPPGAALAFSLLVPKHNLANLGRSGRSAGLPALAVCQALEALYSLAPQIKWPNDVLLGGKKLCGALAEAHWSGEELQALIFGIGINIAPTSVPPAADLNFPATSLQDQLRKPVDRIEVLTAVIERLVALIAHFQATELIQGWESRLAFIGQDVRLKDGSGNTSEGRLLGLDEDGSLKLKLSSNKVIVSQAGEIQLRPLNKNDK
jgi:BirA family biotin operon repressor/biotin-[acetyl-CoA-carboxylase] ligase